MSGGRRHTGRLGTERERRRHEQEASSPHAARRDLVARFAIHRHSRRWGRVVALCTQLSGRHKPGYASRAAAERAAGLLAALDDSVPQRVYLCRDAPGPWFIRQEHWHLASAKKGVDTPMSDR